MDSVTHLAAGVITPLIFKKAPRIWVLVLFGIILGELPDLDMLAGSSAWATLSFHRSLTHALPVIILVSLLVAAIFKFIIGRMSFNEPTVRVEGLTAVLNRPGDWSFGQILGAALLTIGLHVYFDAMTTFGTQLFWPVSEYRVAIPALFIIDPLFTIPLVGVAGYCLAGFKKSENLDRQIRWSRRAFIYMLVYPLFCLSLQQVLTHKINREHVNEETGMERITVMPALLSPFLWKAVAEKGDEYALAHVSIASAFGGGIEFNQPYLKVEPNLWNELRKILPIFSSYGRFVGFPAMSVRDADTGGILEVTIQDLRYTPVDGDDYMFLAGRGNGLFLMQLRISENGRWLHAWRYLPDGDADAEWVILEHPVSIHALTGGI